MSLTLDALEAEVLKLPAAERSHQLDRLLASHEADAGRTAIRVGGNSRRFSAHHTPASSSPPPQSAANASTSGTPH